MSTLNGYVRGLIARQASSSGLQNITLTDFPAPETDTLISVQAMTLADRRFIDNATNFHSAATTFTASRLAIQAVAHVVRCARWPQSGALMFADEHNDNGDRFSDAAIDAALNDAMAAIINAWVEDPDEWMRWGTAIIRALSPQEEEAPELEEEPITSEVDESRSAEALAQLDNTLDAVEKKS